MILVSIAFIFAPIFIISFVLLTLCLIYSSFSKCKFKLFEIFLISKYMYSLLFLSELLLYHPVGLVYCVCIFICFEFFKLPFWFLLLLIGCPKMCCLVSTYLKIFHLSSCCWFLFSYYCGQKRRYDFNHLKFAKSVDVYLVTWSILENVLCALEKNVYSAALGWNVVDMSAKSIWSKGCFNFNVSLLTFLPIGSGTR